MSFKFSWSREAGPVAPTRLDRRRPHAALSDREYQVLRLIASGMTVGGIAEHLSLSVKTVSTYRSRLLQKMGMSNNSEITRYALENGLVE